MRISCKYCKYEYDYERYGASCPQCGTDNQPFRSSGARQAMGFEIERERYFSEERREASARAGDPMYGKSTLRRLRPFLLVLFMAFAVAMLGQAMIRMANEANVSPAPTLPRPPILELADSTHNRAFLPAGGWELRVNASGWVRNQPESAEQWLFVDFLLQEGDRVQMDESPFTPPVATVGELIAPPRALPTEAWAALYTPLQIGLAEDEPGVSGQLFYLLPADTREITLVYLQDGEKQGMVLKIAALKSEN